MTEPASTARQTGRTPRSSPRAPIEVRVECKTLRRFVQATAGNISQGGIMIYCRETFDVSQNVSLRFALPLPGKRNIVVNSSAVVVRAEKDCFMGLRFVGLPAHFRAAIAEYVQHYEKQAQIGPAPPEPPGCSD